MCKRLQKIWEEQRLDECDSFEKYIASVFMCMFIASVFRVYLGEQLKLNLCNICAPLL